MNWCLLLIAHNGIHIPCVWSPYVHCMPLHTRCSSWNSLRDFTFVWPCLVTNFLIIKPTRCTNFPNLLLHVTVRSGSPSAHHQEFIHCTLGTGVCHTGLKTAFEHDQDGTPSWSCSKAVFKPVWHTPVPSVQWINSWWWAEELPETCRVSCQSKFGKLVHLVGFIIRIFIRDTSGVRRIG